MRRSRLLVEGLVSAGLAVVVLGPMLFSRGYVLRGDMVFVPGPAVEGRLARPGRTGAALRAG